MLGRILSASIGRPVRDKWPGCLRISVSATIHTWHEKGCIDSNGSSVSAAYVRRENAYGICNRFCIADSAFLSTFAKHGSVSSSSGGSGGDDGSSSDSESSDESISGSDESSSDSESCDEIVSDDDYSSGETSSSDSDVTSDEVFSDVLSSDDETGSTAANEHHTSSLGSQHVQPKTVKLSDFRRTEDGGIIIHSDVQFDEEEALSNAKDTDKVKSYDLQTLLHNIQRSQARKESAVVREDRTTMMSVEELVDFLREQNARDIVVIELPRELDYVKYFVTCCGAGSRHLGRMADNLVSEVCTCLCISGGAPQGGRGGGLRPPPPPPPQLWATIQRGA